METTDKTKKEELDFSSEKFDALQALTSPDGEVDVPIPEAPVYDNLGQFISSVTRARAGQTVPNDGPGAGHSGYPTTIQRRFLPHQEPVVGRGRSSRRPLRNVLTRMDEVTAGPLSVLRRCMMDKTRIKVWIRSARWIRGWCVGYVAAFDKQWNLAMTDVDETFTRKRRRKTPVYGPVERIAEALEALTTEQQEEADARPPGEEEAEGAEEEGGGGGGGEEEQVHELTGSIVIHRADKGIRRRRNEEVCQRHIQQLFIRGEQVAFVSILAV